MSNKVGNNTKFDAIYVKNMPELKDMAQGQLFISLAHRCSKHLCPCGCGEEVSIPFEINRSSPHAWTLGGQTTEPTFSPSLQNRFECKSHYFIRSGKIEWA